MKKIFLIFCISGLLLNSLHVMSNPSDPIKLKTSVTKDKSEDQTKFQKLLLKLSIVQEKLSTAPEKLKALFNWTSNQFDTILTKKGAIKTLLILGPIFTLYCYFFPPEILTSLFIKISSAAAQGASAVAGATIKGLLNGLGQGIKENKEELKNIFMENKEEIKDLFNELTYETELIRKEAELNAQAASMSASWFSKPFQSILNQASTGLGIGIPVAMQTLITGCLKKRYGFK